MILSEQQHEALVQAQTEQALSYIEDYLKDEFEITEPDFSDLTRIDLGYTTTEDEKHVIQVYADLEHCTVTKLVDDTLYAQERYGSLDDLNQAVLSNLDFDSLMEIDLDEAEEHEPQENTLPADESSAQAPTNYLAPYEPEVPSGAKAKFAANLNAIRTLKQIEQRGTPATEGEQDVLAGYLGWGGLADAFDPNKDNWHSEYTQLKELLTPEEYAAAQESTLTAFYTPPAVIHAMYRALTRMGCVGGNVLEPSMGVGAFFGHRSGSFDTNNAKLYGVELDSVSGRIAQQLYQKAKIQICGYEKADLPDSFFDLAIGNVPFGQYQVTDRQYDKLHFQIHDYFLAKTVDKLRVGGIMAFITTSGTMDKKSEGVRRYLAFRCDLIGAVRLPNNTFTAQAGTTVTSDILFLQKRGRVLEQDAPWIHVGETVDGIPLNRYFIDHPEMICGEMQMVSGPYGQRPTCAPLENGTSLEVQLDAALANLQAEYTLADDREDAKAESDTLDADPDTRNFSYVVKDDTVYYRENSKMRAVKASTTALTRIKALVPLRDTCRELIRAQLDNLPDETIAALQAKLTAQYDSYAETSAAVMGLYVQADADFSAQLVYTAPDGSTLTKVLHVVIDRSRTMAAPFAETTDVAAYAERPTPAVTSGKITKVEKVNGTWLIWFNGEEAYCCTHGANGQPKGCPPYTYTNTSLVSADQCIPGDHYGNQYRIWGGLDQLSMELLPDTPIAFSAEDTEEISLLDFCRTIYDDTQMWLIENYPESTAAKIYLESAQALLDGAVAYAKPRGYYTYIYTPARSGWQTVALIGPEISEEETEEPKPVLQEYYANWEAPAQSASGTVDLTYGITTDKIQLKTLEKVDGATIEIEPVTKSGTIDGGSWSISPAGVQTVTTSGHTNDDNYQNNGGAASASWSVHYAVSKTVDGRSGSVGPYTTKEAADAAANSARDSAVAAIQAEAQSAVNNAIASAQAQLASLQFRYDEVAIPYGFESYWGSNGSHQTITVPANSKNAYEMRNAEWSLQINVKKTDSETGNQIAGDARYEIYQWDVVTGKYQPTGGYNTYSVQRQGDGTYAVINYAAYATNDTMRHTLYYTQRNEGRFIVVETKAPAGYFGDWTDVDHPGTAGTPLGKRAYYVEITADNNNSVLWLGNGDYNADIDTGDKGGTKLVTSGGVETTVTIYDSPKDASRNYTTDASGKAANEDSYTTTAADGIMKNDRTLGEISISKVDLDARRYVTGDAAHGNAVLDGAVYDLYAAEDITHPDGVTGVVDYSKIADANGNPIWHTTIRDNSGQWISDYLPVLKKDNLVASAKIEDGWLTFSNLYLGKYYVVERSTGTFIPLSEGALAVSGTYPTVDSRTKEATGQVAALAASNGQYADWVYKNQFSTISKSKALDGTWTYDAYYLSYAPGYLCDEHNYYITPSYADEGWYVEKTTFANDTAAYNGNYRA